MPDLILANGITVIIGPPKVAVTISAPSVAITMAPPTTHLMVALTRGPEGPRGPAGGETYSHPQTAPAATWVIVHNLGLKSTPTILLDDAPTRAVYTDVDFPDDNTTTLTFPSPVTGWAHF